MTLTVHRPARLRSSLVGDDPAALDVSLPGLPLGTSLDPEVLRGAACGENDLELFYPSPTTRPPSRPPRPSAPPAQPKTSAWRWRW
jgi:hypothetical protein